MSVSPKGNTFRHSGFGPKTKSHVSVSRHEKNSRDTVGHSRTRSTIKQGNWGWEMGYENQVLIPKTGAGNDTNDIRKDRIATRLLKDEVKRQFTAEKRRRGLSLSKS